VSYSGGAVGNRRNRAVSEKWRIAFISELQAGVLFPLERRDEMPVKIGLRVAFCGRALYFQFKLTVFGSFYPCFGSLRR
jgi:hypothetical protein